MCMSVYGDDEANVLVMLWSIMGMIAVCMYVCTYACVYLNLHHSILYIMYACVYVWMDGCVRILLICVCTYVCILIIHGKHVL